MNIQKKKRGPDMDRMFEVLLEGLNENAGLDVKRKIVNAILPIDKYRMLLRLLSNRVIRDDSLLNCLRIFLDENTKVIKFFQYTNIQATIKGILEIIPRYGPNIHKCDLRDLPIRLENQENFKTFLKKTPNMKSLFVDCMENSGAILDLLLEQDFDRLDQDVKSGLLKIEVMDADDFANSQLARLLIILPKLKSFGPYQPLGSLLTAYSEDEVIVQKLSKITEFMDISTSLKTLELFAKLCPKATCIYLDRPEKNVSEHLSMFPLLKELHLYSMDPDFLTEVVNLLKIIGINIKRLVLDLMDFDDSEGEPDPNIVRELCPELQQLEINGLHYRY